MLQDVIVERAVKVTIVLQKLHVTVPDQPRSGHDDRNDEKEMPRYLPAIAHH